MATKGYAPEESHRFETEIPETAFFTRSEKMPAGILPPAAPAIVLRSGGTLRISNLSRRLPSRRFWPSACKSPLHEAQLSHIGTREGLLRRLWKLAEPPAHAGGNPRVVLFELLPCLQSTAGFPASTPTANRTIRRPNLASGVGVPRTLDLPAFGQSAGSAPCESR